MAALKRGASVTVVVWNYKIYPAIEFTPEMYTDKESGDFIDDKKVIEKCNECHDYRSKTI